MNLLLLLTALLASLTGMVTGARADATPVSVVRADAAAERSVVAAAAIAQRHHPLAPPPRLQLAAVPLPEPAFVAADRPVDGRRRE